MVVDDLPDHHHDDGDHVDTADLPVPDDGFYRRYLETCRHLGVEPESPARVRALVEGWNRLILDEGDATTTH